MAEVTAAGKRILANIEKVVVGKRPEIILALVAYWVAWTRRVVTGRPRSAPLAGWAVWTFLVVVVVYAVLRNLPGMGLLAPG